MDLNSFSKYIYFGGFIGSREGVQGLFSFSSGLQEKLAK